MQSQWLLKDHHIYQVKVEIQMSKLPQFTMRTRTAESKRRHRNKRNCSLCKVRYKKCIHTYIHIHFYFIITGKISVVRNTWVICKGYDGHFTLLNLVTQNKIKINNDLKYALVLIITPHSKWCCKKMNPFRLLRTLIWIIERELIAKPKTKDQCNLFKQCHRCGVYHFCWMQKQEEKKRKKKELY